ncbi:MAG: electron transport complex protein RnfG [Candidatus Kentron sp. G]|nr:MAG: electron transport complex protein RnfG [Candidatus Kentron sp. G]VFM95453.1 MAG: electron transport complex protein RnfG [Candidatus Kentron sp. G]VFM97065.1 MAG: electron transport complex protein RnfG [Candidatus Kentron sp. G]
MSEKTQLKEEKQPEEEVRSQEVQNIEDKRSEDASLSETQPVMPSSVSMITVLGLIAMLSGILVVLTYQFTAPIIAEKERLALEAAVFRVVPGVDTESAKQAAFFVDAQGKLVEHDTKEAKDRAKKEGKEPFYAVYDSSNALLGLAMQGAAQGYQDIVRTLFGYDVDKQRIVGMTILKSVDTPGLGDKKTVEKNKKFMANFDDLDVSLSGDKSTVAHSIETVKHGTKTEKWQVDAMSGATITSRAIAKGMSDTTSELLPSLVEHLQAIRLAKSEQTKVKN